MEIECGNPNMFWSAGEDGHICPFDARLGSVSGSSDAQIKAYSLINLRLEVGGQRMAEFKSVRLRPWP